MKKYSFIVLLVGFCFGKTETDSSKINFYKMGVDAAKENFKPKHSYALGVILPSPIYFVPLHLITPVKIEERYNSILNTKNGKSFKKGYVIETKKLRLRESITGSCHTIVVVGTYLTISLRSKGGMW